MTQLSSPTQAQKLVKQLLNLLEDGAMKRKIFQLTKLEFYSVEVIIGAIQLLEIIQEMKTAKKI